MKVLGLIAAIAIGTVAAYLALPQWQGESQDRALQRVISAYRLSPLETKPLVETSKFVLGRALFFDPILSGNRDTSCATCHGISTGTSDGLTRSIGTGGIGEGPDRTAGDSGMSLRRNSLDLWNRDNSEANTFFWDGRVEAMAPEGGVFRTPMGSSLPTGVENTMAAQALFPLVEHIEMLGRPGEKSLASLPPPHKAQRNELADGCASVGEVALRTCVHGAILARLLGVGEPAAAWQATYRELFASAYPEVPLESLSIVHAVNALAHYEELAFATRRTPWDAYLNGNTKALTEEQKRGALVFFGKGRCAICHSGQLLSDFAFHSVGVPSDPRAELDLGRYEVTGRMEDRFKFRTTPLRNVTLTAPYFHDGSASTLEEVLQQHLDPSRYARGYAEDGSHRMSLDEIAAVSPLLSLTQQMSIVDRRSLLAFLAALESPSTSSELASIVPSTVPSGLHVR